MNQSLHWKRKNYLNEFAGIRNPHWLIELLLNAGNLEQNMCKIVSCWIVLFHASTDTMIEQTFGKAYVRNAHETFLRMTKSEYGMDLSHVFLSDHYIYSNWDLRSSLWYAVLKKLYKCQVLLESLPSVIITEWKKAPKFETIDVYNTNINHGSNNVHLLYSYRT